MTILELITSSLRLIGELRAGRTVAETSSHATVALEVLNSMLDAWSTERLAIFNISRATHTLTAGVSAYTIGSGADIDVARPIRLNGAGIVDSNSREYPLELIGVDRFREIGYKSEQATIPEMLYNDNASPVATLNLWPVPSAAYTLVYYPWVALTQVAVDEDGLDFPPGYDEAVRYNLAVRLAPEWGKIVRPDVLATARDSKARIKALNMPEMIATVDPALVHRGRLDINTGDFR